MSDYYRQVAKYYDIDAQSFESRYWENEILQKIRQEFREQLYCCDFENALEIGFGTGLDIVHFAKAYPERKIFGIDVSREMFHHCNQKLQKENITNAFIAIGTPEEIPEIFKNQKFELIYVFFGALNTTRDLQQVSIQFHKLLSNNGRLVLTFVNKWYLAEIVIQSLKLNFRKAFSRFKHTWGGYSNEKFLESKCYSPVEIRKIFGKEFELVKKHGYSILYPAWYRNRWVSKMGRRSANFLWNADRMVNRTFCWKFGEYFLYSLRKRS